MRQRLKKENAKILFNAMERVLKNRERFPAKDYSQIVKNNEFNQLLDTYAIDSNGYKLYYMDSRQLSLKEIPNSGLIHSREGLAFEFKTHDEYPFILGVVAFNYE